MSRQTLIYWISAAFATLFGIIITGFGIYQGVRGQNCQSYADLGCAMGAVFAMAIIPYGASVLFIIGLASLPFKPVSLIGSILSILAGVAHFGLCCITTTWAFNSDGFEMVSNTEAFYFLFPLFFFLTGIALLGLGISGYQSLKQQ